MFYKPVLARCNDREVKARSHPFSGKPEDWLANSHLALHGLTGVSFDFFVNWKTRLISSELWIKRLVKASVEPWPVNEPDAFLSAIYQCDGEDTVRTLCGFADRYGLSCHYFLFKESLDWELHPATIVEAKFNRMGSVENLQNIKIPVLKLRIQRLSGGPVAVGWKGLIYGLTSLECFLSRTDAAWPGDADLVLVDSNLAAFAIIEFKKHNLNTPIADQRLSNYYPRPDGRKYDRLALLKSHLGVDSNIRVIVIYYPTRQSVDQVKLERIEGQAGGLRTAYSAMVPLPVATDERSCRAFVNSVIGIASS